MKPAAIIFDLDGTLADTMPAHFSAWQEVGPRHGISFPEERFYSLGGWPTQRIIELLAHEQGLSLDSKAVAIEKEQAFLAHLHEVQRIEPVVSVALQNVGKLPMAIATGSRRHQAQAVLRQTRLDTLFDTVLCAEDCPTHKPDPGLFLLAASKLGIAPELCLVYEDTDPGIQAAQRAGMQWVDVRILRATAHKVALRR